ncbi:hypothetical protein AMTR_s00060p00066070 [Amborella trichopoda]|uniref:NmrA-like domain-containing protein n=2 Tax=Amborella trichopoda TaxID=13333 RepID=W1NK33_AMBTC|nr:hypothetical protein AMTR_s00060p00066070 [Amborella trichopoda]
MACVSEATPLSLPASAGMKPRCRADGAKSGNGGSRVLIIGATGYIGRFVAEASVMSGKPTFILLRHGPAACPAKAQTVRALEDAGATIVHGSMQDRELMERILAELKIDVVISTVAGAGSILDQLHLIDAIRAVGTVKRFVPSEFGHDIDKAEPVEPALAMYKEKRMVRRAAEGLEIPCTYICCNSIAAWPYHDNTHPSEVPPPLDRFLIYGDGNIKAYFVAGTDIGKMTVKAVDDERTLNMTLHFRPVSNFLTLNEMASLWEKKIKRTLSRATMTEDDLLNLAKENRIPESIVAALTHDIFIKGCQFGFSIDGPHDVEVGQLYPDEPLRSISDCFDDYLQEIVPEIVGPMEIVAAEPQNSLSVPLTCIS